MTETRYLNATDTGAIDAAAKLLLEGKLVAFPTETVYGLGAHAFNQEAVARIFEVKQRPRDNPIIIHVSSASEAASLFSFEDSPFKERFRVRFDVLSKRMWPGPLTLVGTKAAHVPSIVSGGSTKIAVRVPSHPIAQKLLASANLPVAAPSANLFTRPSPTRSAHVETNLDSRIDAILEGGPCEFGIESTVLDIDAEMPKILRHGVVCVRELKEILNEVEVSPIGASTIGKRASPGLSDRHYSPQIPEVRMGGLSDLAKAWFSGSGIVLREQTQKQLRLQLGERPPQAGATRCLPDNPMGFAKELFAAFYEMEASALRSLIVEDMQAFSNEPKWMAICDKLLRAKRDD